MLEAVIRMEDIPQEEVLDAIKSVFLEQHRVGGDGSPSLLSSSFRGRLMSSKEIVRAIQAFTWSDFVEDGFFYEDKDGLEVLIPQGEKVLYVCTRKCSLFPMLGDVKILQGVMKN